MSIVSESWVVQRLLKFSDRYVDHEEFETVDYYEQPVPQNNDTKEAGLQHLAKIQKLYPDFRFRLIKRTVSEETVHGQETV